MFVRTMMWVAAAQLIFATPSFGAWANDYAVYGNNSLTFQGFAKVSGGPAGSNGNVFTQAGSAYFDNLYGGGALNPTTPVAWNGRQNVTGNVIFNGNVTINALSTIGGSIHSGGSVSDGGSVGGAIVAPGSVFVDIYNNIGSVTSGSDVNLSTGVQVAGNVGANGNVSVGQSAKVTGTITNPGTVTQGAFSSIGGHVNGTVNPAPLAYTPVVLPPATSFTSGGVAVTLNTFNDVALAPGKYGALSLAGSTKLRLSGGNYYFDSITSPGTFSNLYLDLSGAPINIFVTGDAQFNRVHAYVNNADYTTVAASLAGNVLLEAHGNINMTGNFFGTLFSPTGDITTGTIGSVTGQVIAGHDAVIGSATNITDGATTYVPSAYLAAEVPEPSTGLILLVGTLAGLRLRPRGATTRPRRAAASC